MRRLLLVMMFASSGYLLTATWSPAQTGDAWIGTWTLNVAQSSYDPTGLAPMSQTTKISASGDTVVVISDGVNAQGQKTHDETTYRFDGKDYGVKGAADPDTVRVYTRIDDHHYSYATKVNGLITINSRVAVTADGQTRTIVTTGRDPQGRTIRNFSVWNKIG
jgi:hypothetical protein